MDQMVEEAFRLNVKYSLQELSKAVNGDGKAAPNPLFKVKVVLKNNKVFQVLVHLVPQILCHDSHSFCDIYSSYIYEGKMIVSRDYKIYILCLV
jgi:hypothetical protein